MTIRKPAEPYENTIQQIVPANVKALQAIYAAAMFEELKVFSAVDRLVELFQQGRLVITNSKANSPLQILVKQI